MQKEQTIVVEIETCDKLGNEILAREKMVFSPHDEMALPKYISLFISVLKKHEFSNSQIQKALHDYFLEVDKKDFPG